MRSSSFSMTPLSLIVLTQTPDLKDDPECEHEPGQRHQVEQNQKPLAPAVFCPDQTRKHPSHRGDRDDKGGLPPLAGLCVVFTHAVCPSIDIAVVHFLGKVRF